MGECTGGPTGRPSGAAAAVPVLLLAAAAVAWAAAFVWLGALRHTRFATFGFDLGIYDQAAWLLAHGHLDGMITVRGLRVFGHHVNPVLFAYAPAYRLGAGVEVLLVTQVAAQAAAALVCFAIGVERLGDRWLALGPALALLANPTWQWLTWEFFHPEVLAGTALLGAWWAALRRRWWWFAAAVVLAVACREDVALVTAVLGLVVAGRGERRVGLATAAASLGWYLVATRVILVWGNGTGPFYEAYFADLGDGPGAVLRTALTRPWEPLGLAIRPDRLAYLGRMLGPFAFLPLAGPVGLALAAPALAVNLLSSFPYTRELTYHYQALVVPALAIGAVEAVARLGRRGRPVAAVAALVLLAAAVATSLAWGPSPLGTRFRTGIWPLDADPRQPARERAVRLVPPAAPVSATYTFVPHLTHRRAVYEFPNPWRTVNWGVRGEGAHDPRTVRWLVADRSTVGPGDRAQLERLLAGPFRVVQDRDGIVVARRR